MRACVHVVHGRLQLRPAGGGVPELAAVRPPALFSPTRCSGGFLSKSKYPSLSLSALNHFFLGTTSERERLNESFVFEKIGFENFSLLIRINLNVKSISSVKVYFLSAI